MMHYVSNPRTPVPWRAFLEAKWMYYTSGHSYNKADMIGGFGKNLKNTKHKVHLAPKSPGMRIDNVISAFLLSTTTWTIEEFIACVFCGSLKHDAEVCE